ncbi:MAG: winged helix-turn-helix transcriptional regulator [Candidatus Helarchaeota archaeon]|nr:winged helix-turn-helix transcriptional regulator [Candidatus Helarchaeota archaeon]
MKEIDEKIVSFLKVMADTTRLEILNFLKNTEKTASEIQNAIKKSQSTVSQQIKILISADLVEYRRDGAKKYYKVRNPKIFDIISVIKSYISSQNREKIDKMTSLDILDTLH